MVIEYLKTSQQNVINHETCCDKEQPWMSVCLSIRQSLQNLKGDDLNQRIANRKQSNNLSSTCLT